MTGWIYVPDIPHRCIRPQVNNYPPGSIWRCDDCGLLWIVKTNPESSDRDRVAYKYLDPMSPAEAQAFLDLRESGSKSEPVGISE